jgi:hypothetical protein
MKTLSKCGHSYIMIFLNPRELKIEEKPTLRDMRRK